MNVSLGVSLGVIALGVGGVIGQRVVQCKALVLLYHLIRFIGIQHTHNTLTTTFPNSRQDDRAAQEGIKGDAVVAAPEADDGEEQQQREKGPDAQD